MVHSRINFKENRSPDGFYPFFMRPSYVFLRIFKETQNF